MVAINQKPKFITVEGIEGVGKSTCIAFINQYLKSQNVELCLTREPGGTPIAEQIRQVLLSHHDEKMTDDTELLLMFASRAQHLSQIIKPALATGKWVICDRFTDASYAYQGGGRGISMEKIATLENLVQADLRPDITILLDAPPEIALARMHNRSQPDRIEKEQSKFFEKVRNCYLERSKQYPQQYRVVDASQELENVKLQIKNILDNYL